VPRLYPLAFTLLAMAISVQAGAASCQFKVQSSKFKVQYTILNPQSSTIPDSARNCVLTHECYRCPNRAPPLSIGYYSIGYGYFGPGRSRVLSVQGSEFEVQGSRFNIPSSILNPPPSPIPLRPLCAPPPLCVKSIRPELSLRFLWGLKAPGPGLQEHGWCDSTG
jgi:hypothetical protein